MSRSLAACARCGGPRLDPLTIRARDQFIPACIPCRRAHIQRTFTRRNTKPCRRCDGPRDGDNIVRRKDGTLHPLCAACHTILQADRRTRTQARAPRFPHGTKLRWGLYEITIAENAAPRAKSVLVHAHDPMTLQTHTRRIRISDLEKGAKV